MRTARIGNALAAVVAAIGWAGVRETMLQLRPRSREMSKPSSVAAYQASRLKAMSFTLAWNGTVDFTIDVAGDFAGALEACAFEPFGVEVFADTFFMVTAGLVGTGTDFSDT